MRSADGPEAEASISNNNNNEDVSKMILVLHNCARNCIDFYCQVVFICRKMIKTMTTPVRYAWKIL